MKRLWQDWVNLILGVLIFLSPWILGFSDISSGSWLAWIVGILLIVLSAWALSNPAAWIEWVNVILGVIVILSPWIGGIAAKGAGTTWTLVIAGIIIAVVAYLAQKEKAQAS